MRTELTPPEQRLWHVLRAGRLDGAKFRRQVVIGPYIADFACRQPAMIVVEADGDTHAPQANYDADRTRFLERRGYRVLRFANSDILNNLEGVLEHIRQALRTPPLPNPLP